MEAKHPGLLNVHLNTEILEVRFDTVADGLVELLSTADPLNTDHVPIPLVALFALNEAVVPHTD